jgi:hypothetical protein
MPYVPPVAYPLDLVTGMSVHDNTDHVNAQDAFPPSPNLLLLLLGWNVLINPLMPREPYMGRTAQLTSRRCILNTYSTNIHNEYFKHAA